MLPSYRVNHVPNKTPTMVTSDAAIPSLANYEAYKGSYNKSHQSLIVGGGLLKNSNIDISWLPGAAESYAISADPNDYVLVDVPIVTVDIPNRNMQAFPYEEVSYFDPLYGKFVYQTFNGKPCHIDHVNGDPLKAKGVIFDVSMEYVKAYNIHKIRILTGWDRTKDPKLVKDILSGKRTGYSMGCLVDSFVCSACGAVDTNMRPCRHMDVNAGMGKGALWNFNTNTRIAPNKFSMAEAEMVKLIYQACVGCNYVENSSVEDPADPSADTVGANNPIWFS